MPKAGPPIVDPELLANLPDKATKPLTMDSLAVKRRLIQASLDAQHARPSGGQRIIHRVDGSELRILLSRPTVHPPRGALLWMHGGGMVMGSASMDLAQSQAAAEHAGCLVASVEYRLAPEHPYPAALDDCYLAYKWLNSQTAEFAFATSRIAVGGESSGGCLAAGLALRCRDDDARQPSGIFLQYAMLDDRTGSANDPDPMPYAGRYIWTKEDNRFAIGCVLGDQRMAETAPGYAAPARVQQLAGLPPVFLAVGDIDLYAAENLRFATSLIRVGISVELHVYPGAFHSFISVAPEAAVSRRALADLLAALEKHFSPAEP